MWSLENASPARLQTLARELDAAEKWESYLTPHEHQLFAVAVEHSPEIWKRFLKGLIPCQLRVHNDDTISTTDVDPVTLAFRVRYMLWESQLDDVFGSFRDFHIEGSPARPTSSTKQIGPPETLENHDSGDDYDDDDEEVAEQPDVLDEIVVDAVVENKVSARGRQQAIQRCSRMYDSFDEDTVQIMRYQKLHEADKPESDDEKETAPIEKKSEPQLSSLAALAKTAQFGSANLCLKHLLTKIEARRSELRVTDVELRNLISDVRKNRSKWASEDRIGQEELYEACERVVHELRGYTQHSAAFLNKVSKREAPNYYDVIKSPMDLNTVMRKLKMFQYITKAEFVADLNLIWSNCLTYNSDPAHYLRPHALAMREKTQVLTPLIPDVTVRPRAEVEAEAEMLERKRRRETEEMSCKKPKSDISTPSKDVYDAEESTEAGSAALEAAENAENAAIAAAETTAGATGEDTEEKSDYESQKAVVKATDEAITKTEGAADDVARAEEHLKEAELSSEALGEYDRDHESEQPDAESSVWESVTRRRRLQCIAARQQLFVNDQLQMDAPAAVRTPGGMLRFERAIRGDDSASQITGMSLLSTDAREEPFMVEYEVMSGVPVLPVADASSWIHAPVPRLQDLKPSRYVAKGELNKLMMRNLNEMQLIRRLCSKILFIKELQSGEYVGTAQAQATQASAQDYASIVEPEEDISSRMPGAAPIDRLAAFSGMRRAAAKLAMNAGFEASQGRAIDALAGIAGDYLMKLGGTLVANLEAPDSTASFTKILEGSLESMGVEKLGVLTKYISDDVLRQGRRLATFRSRLNSTLVDILRPEVERYQDDQFQDNSDQFVLGQFSNELGDDYFGFKELGIDKELGVANIAIPFHLLQQRVADSAAGVPGRGKSSEQEMSVPAYPPITAEDVAALPQFVRSAFEKILGDMSEEHLQQLAAQVSSQRAKIPASGKLVPRKKRADRAYRIPPPPAIEEVTKPATPESMVEENRNPHESLAGSEVKVEESTSIAEESIEPNKDDDIDGKDEDEDKDGEDKELDEVFDVPAPAFSFNDSMTTGSLLMQGDDDRM